MLNEFQLSQGRHYSPFGKDDQLMICDFQQCGITGGEDKLGGAAVIVG
jgi:hypothetical protein